MQRSSYNQTRVNYTEKISIKLRLHKAGPEKMGTHRRDLYSYFYHNKMANDYLSTDEKCHCRITTKVISYDKDPTEAYSVVKVRGPGGGGGGGSAPAPISAPCSSMSPP